ncbi:CK1 protein kinase [Aphelenchoides besseyi]|nr:CK1 protein kinase [Aphelenchoides besseyi]
MSSIQNQSTAVRIGTAEPLIESAVHINELIDGRFIVKKRINEGAFGAIYEVAVLQDQLTHMAMKLSLTKNDAMDQLAKFEISLLRKLSAESPCFPAFHATGMVRGYRYVVMDLLGSSLADLQMLMPGERFTLSTTIRVGLQIIDVNSIAIEVMHNAFFLHRDIKPGNMAVGHSNVRKIYLFDFGLSRCYTQKKESGVFELRPERPKAPFRGTHHYCSLLQHENRDSARRDDLWSVMYTLIEFTVGFLPWDHEREKSKIAEMKRNTKIEVLLQGCPLIFAILLDYLTKLEYNSRPSYDYFRQAFRILCSARQFDDSDLFDWEKNQTDPATPHRQRSISEKAVYDRASQTSEITELSSDSEEED